MTAQPLLLDECARIRRRVKLDSVTVRTTIRWGVADRRAAQKMAAEEGISLSELIRDALYADRGIGELEGED